MGVISFLIIQIIKYNTMSSKLEIAMNEAYKQAGENAYFGTGFKMGAEYVKKEYEEKLRFIPIEEKLPENGDEIELQNNDWINEYNPKGIRSGYYDKCKNPIFYSCYWNTDEECYDTSTQPPTHWRSFL